MIFLIYTVSLKIIQSIFFFFSKWRLLIFSGGNHPLPAIFDDLPYPPEGRTPDFISSKWSQRMYFRLHRWLRSLSFWCWGDREKSRGGGNHPLGRMRVNDPFVLSRRYALIYFVNESDCQQIIGHSLNDF